MSLPSILHVPTFPHCLPLPSTLPVPTFFTACPYLPTLPIPAQANQQEVAYAVANVVAFGLLGLLMYPFLAHHTLDTSEQVRGEQ